MFTRLPPPRQAHRLRMGVFFVGVLVLASFLMLRSPLFFVFMISGFFYASILRPLPLAFVGVFATSFLVNTLIAGFPQSAEAWTFYVVIIAIQTVVIGAGSIVGEKVTEQNEERRAGAGQAGGGARGERRASRPAADPGPRGGHPRRAGAHGPRDPRHHRPGPHRDRHPARGGRAGAPIDRPIGIGISTTPGGWHATAWWKRVDRSRRRCPPHSSPEPCPMRSPRSPPSASEMNGIPVDVTVTGDVIALHPEIEVALLRTAQEALANVARHSGASRAGLTLSFMGDVVTLDVRDDGVGFSVRGGFHRRRLGLRPHRHAPARGARRRVARHRVGAGRRHRALGAGARRSPPALRRHRLHEPGPPDHRRRPPRRPRRHSRHARGRSGARRRRRGIRRGRGPRPHRVAEARCRPDGPAHARPRRSGNHPNAGRAGLGRARARADDLRHRQRRRAGARGRRDRLPAQGLPARGARPRHPRSSARRDGAGAVGRDAPGEPASGARPRRTERPRARGAHIDRPGRDEPRGGGAPVHLGGHRQDAPAPHLREARRQRQGRRRCRGLREAASWCHSATDPQGRVALTSSASRYFRT